MLSWDFQEMDSSTPGRAGKVALLFVIRKADPPIRPYPWNTNYVHCSSVKISNHSSIVYKDHLWYKGKQKYQKFFLHISAWQVLHVLMSLCNVCVKAERLSTC